MKIGFEAQRLFRAHKHGMDFVALELTKALQRLDKENEYIIYINEGDDPCIEETDNFKIQVFAGFKRWIKGSQKATWERARRAAG